MHMSEWTVEVIRSAYSLNCDQHNWLTRVATVLAKSIAGASTWVGCGFQVCGGGLQPTAFATSGTALALINPLLDVCWSASPGLRQAFAGRTGGIGSVRGWDLSGFAEVKKHLRAGQHEDCFFVFAVCDDDTGCAFFFPCEHQPRTSQSRRWGRVLPHITAGWQFRRPGVYLEREEARALSARAAEATLAKVRGELAPSASASAPVTANEDTSPQAGSLAGSPARNPIGGARSWQQLAISSDSERGDIIGRAPVEALWRQVFEGRWTRLAHFSGAGRRYIVLRRLRGSLGRPLALTVRERRIVELATSVEYPDLRGIAREMKCKESTAATHLARAMKKLGVHSRAELIALMVGGPADEGPRG